MKLIADSGSSKTAWKLVSGNGETRDIQTSGINPYFRTSDDIYQELQALLFPETGEPVEHIWFYGAGVTSPAKGDIVREALARLYPAAEIAVESDLLGACRALLGHRAGIACILGTGSNACLYDGQRVVSNVPPLGFILGDEGSGAVMGKHLVGDYLKGVMPDRLRERFSERFALTMEEALERVYRQPRPNYYLAGFTPFLSENIGETYCRDFVARNLAAFVERNVLRLEDCHRYPIAFTGSVAWHFSTILQQALSDHGLGEAIILQAPIGGLVSYHNQDPITE